LKDNIVKMSKWKERAELMQQSVKAGWDTRPSNLTEINNPANFYICEPVETLYTAMSLIDRSVIEDYVEKGTKEFGTKDQIFEAVSHHTADFIQNNTNDVKMLESVITGNIVHFANSKTAKKAILNKDINHFGVIIYQNYKRADVINLTFRPMALGSPHQAITPEELFGIVCTYMMNDYAKHPEYFDGHDINKIIPAFAVKMGF